MKNKKSVTLGERGSHLLIYLSLLVAALFLAFRSPDELWLSIGLGVGIVLGLAGDLMKLCKERAAAKQNKELSTKIDESVENCNRSDDTE